MSENSKKILIGGLIVVVILLAWYLGRNSIVNQPGGGKITPMGIPAQSETRSAVSPNVVVPGATSTVSSEVAKPSIVAQASPNSSSKFRSFSISVSGGKFLPNTVIVNVGDIVHLNITAIDKDYDFYQPDYGLSQSLPKGVQKVIEFQVAAEGKYTFYCKSCGGPNKGPVGYIVVVPKK